MARKHNAFPHHSTVAYHCTPEQEVNRGNPQSTVIYRKQNNRIHSNGSTVASCGRKEANLTLRLLPQLALVGRLLRCSPTRDRSPLCAFARLRQDEANVVSGSACERRGLAAVAPHSWGVWSGVPAPRLGPCSLCLLVPR